MLEGIEVIEMHLEQDEFWITYQPATIDEQQIIAAVKGSGYQSTVVTGNIKTKVEATKPSESKDPLYQDALTKAKKENKPIVLDFYASWCTPCMRMLKETFPDPKVVKLLSQCVFVKVDTDKHLDLAKSFGVHGLPDIRLLSPNGKEKKQLLNFQNAASLANELQQLLKIKD